VKRDRWNTGIYVKRDLSKKQSHSVLSERGETKGVYEFFYNDISMTSVMEESLVSSPDAGCVKLSPTPQQNYHNLQIELKKREGKNRNKK